MHVCIDDTETTQLIYTSLSNRHCMLRKVPHAGRKRKYQTLIFDHTVIVQEQNFFPNIV